MMDIQGGSKDDQKKIFMIKLAYFSLFGATACVFTLLPVFLKSNGLNESQIGVLSSLLPLITCWASPLWSAVADRFKKHRCLFFCAVMLSAFSRIFYLGSPPFGILIFWFSLASFLDAPQAPFLDAFSMGQLTDVTTWGRIRLWGAIGFGVFSFVSGFIISETSFGWTGMFVVYWALMLMTFVLLLPVFQSTSSDEIILNNGSLVDQEIGGDAENIGIVELTAAQEWDKMLPEGSENLKKQKECKQNEDEHEDGGINHGSEDVWENDKDKVETLQNDFDETLGPVISDMLGDLISILSVSENICFLVIIFVGGASAGIIDTFLYVFLKNLGGSELLMGTARAITCIAEIPFFHYANVLIHRFGEHGVLLIALFFYTIRLTYYSFLENIPLWAVLPAETLHGFTYAALWAASTSYGFKIAPPHMKTTVQGLVSGVHWGIGFGLGSLVGGFAFHAYGAVKLFRSAAGMVGVVLAASVAQNILFKAIPCEKNMSTKLLRTHLTTTSNHEDTITGYSEEETQYALRISA